MGESSRRRVGREALVGFKVEKAWARLPVREWTESQKELWRGTRTCKDLLVVLGSKGSEGCEENWTRGGEQRKEEILGEVQGAGRIGVTREDKVVTDEVEDGWARVTSWVAGEDGAMAGHLEACKGKAESE